VVVTEGSSRYRDANHASEGGLATEVVSFGERISGSSSHGG